MKQKLSHFGHAMKSNDLEKDIRMEMGGKMRSRKTKESDEADWRCSGGNGTDIAGIEGGNQRQVRMEKQSHGGHQRSRT